MSSTLDQALAEFERVMAAPRDDRQPPAESDPLDEYEPGTVLDPEDQEVLDLLREIGEYERRERRQ